MSDHYCDPCPEFDINIFKGLTILVADDTQDNVFLTRYILKSYGIQVISASNASSAFALIKHESVDLLISDIDLPDESGYSLIHRVRSLMPLQTRDIPAIALSEKTHKQAHQQALTSGFQTYIQKPSNPLSIHKYKRLLIIEIAKLLCRSNRNSSSLFSDYSCLLTK
ncbi:response regulator [Komarekiella sp. 'clone 1']|uniref:Response regulator n=1 Tax=Komarekiella delphini-convector SJRDD-AB1 TaxID=2593771 RepID=A0AA40T4T4_9NOST|nr:response regulator [Komarekiella delphini-convector SJRDD-AB1]